ncbi:acyl-CoA dehydrogenase [Emcibacter nanhaiensis]|uniref:Acyl-CoA dehydrogenase n=1 Tax=Emcibacter nanhaiensis TaxID=1505037 RepID=A0A501PNJ7_9PROT|nr:acyl-CoA dehydrogenase [Emcibacter nanhaiensis]TPD61738.1 acyl-CoA dehydrogenase [Emcibacter nanhaiensis]
MSFLFDHMREVNFQLHNVLESEQAFSGGVFADYTPETMSAFLETARAVAEDHYLPHYQTGDQQEPAFDGEKVHLLPELADAWRAFADAGFLSAHHDAEHGGMHMPQTLNSACMSFFYGANISFSGYSLLTIGAGNLIRSFGTEDQIARFLAPMTDGRFAGTMALTEPGQGSALSDIKTTAELQPDGSYRLKGHKMFISGGDQSITENIVHMVLARIKGAPEGVKGISLFICPKVRVGEDGSLGDRNDVALAGLLHKMGYRHTTSTVLNFGENDNCEAFLVGEPNRGLSYMFQMMNEARINVGLGAVMLGLAGYHYSLNYARERQQGRLPSCKDPLSPQVPLVAHPDIRRLLLAQKAYGEGALALALYASQQVDRIELADDGAEKKRLLGLLDLLTPVVKSYPSEYGLEANKMAIQVLGGSGYIREYPVEQYYRDNRLNPIHEGTEGIQGLDLLGRKVVIDGGASLKLLLECIAEDVRLASEDVVGEEITIPVAESLDLVGRVTRTLTGKMAEDVDLALANATLYLDFMGRVIIAWMWLRQARAAKLALNEEPEGNQADYYQGKLQAARYFMGRELTRTKEQANILMGFESSAFEMQDSWF